MRTTLTLDDDLASRLKQLAEDRRQPFRQVLNEVLRRGLTATGKPRRLTDDGKRNAYPTFTPDGETLVFTSARGGGSAKMDVLMRWPERR